MSVTGHQVSNVPQTNGQVIYLLVCRDAIASKKCVHLLVLDHLDLLLAEHVRPVAGLAGGPALASAGGASLHLLGTPETCLGSSCYGTFPWTSSFDMAGTSSLASAPSTAGSHLLGHDFPAIIMEVTSYYLLFWFMTPQKKLWDSHHNIVINC